MTWLMVLIVQDIRAISSVKIRHFSFYDLLFALFLLKHANKTQNYTTYTNGKPQNKPPIS